jgi:anti-anti-sigma factor
VGKFEVEELDKGYIIKPIGNVMTSEDAEQFQEITDKIANSDKKNLIIDFSGTTLLGSLLIGHLVRVQAHFDRMDGKIAFCNFQDAVDKILKMTRINTIINTYDSFESAKTIFK